MRVIDKWAAGRVDVLTRLDTAKDFMCHQGVWKCRTGSNYIGEYRSCVGSLHDSRTVDMLYLAHGKPLSCLCRARDDFRHGGQTVRVAAAGKPVRMVPNWPEYNLVQTGRPLRAHP